MTAEPNSVDSSESKKSKQFATQTRSIFRVEAQQHYLANEERIVFPRLLSNQFFIILWIVALLLFLIGFIITFWPLLGPLMWG